MTLKRDSSIEILHGFAREVENTRSLQNEKNIENPKLCNAVSLAFIGDAVFELLVRRALINKQIFSPGELHRQSTKLVCAASQARAAQALLPVLTDEEADIYRRGRNANGVHVPKSASAKDYRSATGFEALFGYLYLKGEDARIADLFEQVLNVLDGES